MVKFTILKPPPSSDRFFYESPYKNNVTETVDRTQSTDWPRLYGL